jgi:hypothetical protein
MALALSYSIGQVGEAQFIATTSVSGDRDRISSSVAESTRARVTWSNGKLSDYRFDMYVSSGDKVIVIWLNEKGALEYNATTDGWKYIYNTASQDGGILGLAMLSIFLFGIGFLLTPIAAYYVFTRRKKTRAAIMAYLADVKSRPDVVSYLGA